MKFILPIVLVVVTAILIGLALVGGGQARGTVGIAAGSALPGLSPNANTPEKGISNLLAEVKRRNWDRAYASLAKSNRVDEPTFIQDWTGSNGSLRSFSSLESFDARPMHATGDEAQFRVRLHWSTPVGPVEDVRDVRVTREGD